MLARTYCIIKVRVHGRAVADLPRTTSEKRYVYVRLPPVPHNAVKDLNTTELEKVNTGVL